MKESEPERKKRIIKRFMAYSDIYTESYLNSLNLDELVYLQKESLIELSVKHKYKIRNSPNRS